MSELPQKQTELKVTTKEDFSNIAINLIKFNQILNRNPDPKLIKTNNGAKYIPIRTIENHLRSIFGVWETEMIGQPQILGNSVVVSIHLKVYHPILKEWIKHAGTGAVPIQLKRTKKDRNNKVTEQGAVHALDFEKINPTALHKNVPAALSFAVSNAAKKLGKLFGSDLNNDEMSGVYNAWNL